MQHMVTGFASLDLRERPVLILKTAGGTPLGVLGNAKNVSLDMKYNETSTLEFELPARVDGEDTPYYDDVVGMRIIDVVGVGQFTLVKPEETDDGIQKTKKCKAYSLEYEFVYKKITIGEGTFKLWDNDASKRKDTLLGMVMEIMPSWKVGSIPDSLARKYRTYEVNNENIYNFLKGTAQQSYNCIFEFDTYTRTVSVRDLDDEAREQPVYISTENLAKEIVVTEETEDIVTRLDVNGADGVDIRDVNPTGTNSIINLDYFMTEENFDKELIDKYFAWKELCKNNKQTYYTLSIEYTMNVEQKTNEQVKLVELQGELTSLDNMRGVTIQAIAEGLSTQEDLDKINEQYRAKEAEIREQEAKIAAVDETMKESYDSLVKIRDACSYDKYFNLEERIQMDKYIKDGEVSESSFVATATADYADTGTGFDISGKEISVSDCAMEKIENSIGGTIYDISGGNISVGDELKAALVSAVVDVHEDGSAVITGYLNRGTRDGNEFEAACISFSGDVTGILTTEEPQSIMLTATGHMYFTLNATEYQKRSVAWDLYEYGEEILARLAQPTYTFSVDSANFFTAEDFRAFKNSLRIGEKIYIELSGRVLMPICIGVHFEFEDLPTLELEFSDSFVSTDSTFRLVDLLNKSVSMGKSVDIGKYTFAEFADSGANTALRDFMNSALDVAKNAILSSSGQAVSWDAAGLKLRKWADEDHTSYEDEQIWMNNNSIVMTNDSWNTAKLAIGKFKDENAGECWGIVAEMIMGTMIAGTALVIESEKKDGDTAVFRMDGDGCRLYNSEFTISGHTQEGEDVHITLNPDLGIALGNYPIFDVDENGKKTLNEENAKFWVDMQGNLHFKGTLEGANGSFSGEVRASSLIIEDKSVDDYMSDKIGEETDSKFDDLHKEVELKVSKDEFSSMLKNDETMSQVVQEAGKISWLIESGDSQASMMLTDRVFELVSENFTVTDELISAIAERIDLSANESINLLVTGMQEDIDDNAEQLGDLASEQNNMATYLRLVYGEGVYIGYQGGSAEAFISQNGVFAVLVNGEAVTEMGANYQRIGKLTFSYVGDNVVVRRTVDG